MTQPTQPITNPDFDYSKIDQRKQINPTYKQFIREIFETVVLVFLLFFFINGLTGRFRIEGQSMEPTMHEGQYLIVNRLSYNFNQPTRGDIVVINYPRDPSRDFIKRVVGVPGDVVTILNGSVDVNGAVIDEPYILAAPNYEGSWTVPQDQLFVLGDNRLNSSDSHSWGFVPYDLVEGRAEIVYWPWTEMQRIPHHAHDNIPNAEPQATVDLSRDSQEQELLFPPIQDDLPQIPTTYPAFEIEELKENELTEQSYP